MFEHQIKAYDEFASIFKGALKPHIKIKEVKPEKILLILDDSDQAESLRIIAYRMRERFNSSIIILAHKLKNSLKKKWQQKMPYVRIMSLEKVTAKDLLHHIKKVKASLVMIPVKSEVEEELEEGGFDNVADDLMRKSTTPLLLLKEPVKDPSKVFSRLLTYVPGTWGAVEEFSWSFTLTEDIGGSLELLHVIEEDTIQQVEGALELSSTVNTDSSKSEVVENFKKSIQDLFEQAVKKSRTEPFEVKTHITIGDPVKVCKDHVNKQKATLLILKTKRGTKAEYETYEIAREVSKVPILVM